MGIKGADGCYRVLQLSKGLATGLDVFRHS